MRECHPREIVLCFDNEETDRSFNYFNHLYDICKKYSRYCNFSFIYDKEHLTNLKDSPSDKGQETFERLLRKRVHVK